jgi:hypothetical protein
MTQLRMGLRWGLGVLVAVGLLGMAGGAPGQSLSLGHEAHTVVPKTFGTSSATIHTLQALAFTGFSAADDARIGSTGLASRFCTSNCVLGAPLLLPAGARVTGMKLDGCDDSAADFAFAGLYQTGRTESGQFLLFEAGTFVLNPEATPGCREFAAHLVVPHTIDNVNNAYFVQVNLPGAGFRFQAVRVFYQLQVSAAPGVATFGDVPTDHPFFRFIEALWRSGITSGCSGGNYCPDAPAALRTVKV